MLSTRVPFYLYSFKQYCLIFTFFHLKSGSQISELQTREHNCQPNDCSGIIIKFRATGSSPRETYRRCQLRQARLCTFLADAVNTGSVVRNYIRVLKSSIFNNNKNFRKIVITSLQPIFLVSEVNIIYVNNKFWLYCYWPMNKKKPRLFLTFSDRVRVCWATNRDKSLKFDTRITQVIL